MKMLQVRTQKTVHDAKGTVIGTGGELLPIDAPIRESDRSKVVEVFVQDEPAVTDAPEDLE